MRHTTPATGTLAAPSTTMPWLDRIRRRAPYTVLVATCAVWMGDVQPGVVEPAAPFVAVPVPEESITTPLPIDPTRPIAGWVVDDNGVPIRGVRVRFRDTTIAADTDA